MKSIWGHYIDECFDGGVEPGFLRLLSILSLDSLQTALDGLSM